MTTEAIVVLLFKEKKEKGRKGLWKSSQLNN